MDDLYQEHILDHYKHPRNIGRLVVDASKGQLIHAVASNQGCGDDLSADILIQNGKVTDLKWTGTGCAISQAAMSILSEWVIGKTISEIQALDLSQILSLLGLPEIASAREKCLMLPKQLFSR